MWAATATAAGLIEDSGGLGAELVVRIVRHLLALEGVDEAGAEHVLTNLAGRVVGIDHGDNGNQSSGNDAQNSGDAGSNSGGDAQQPAGGDGEITIALITNTTGDYAQYGIPVHNAAMLYINQLNENGGINGKQIKVLEYDDKAEFSAVGKAALPFTAGI